MLPLVCRRFHHLLRQPKGCWREMDFVRPLHPLQHYDAEVERAHGFLNWAFPRALGVHVFTLDLQWLTPGLPHGGWLWWHTAWQLLVCW